MKAAVLYANGDIRFEEYETPEVIEGHVKVRVRVSGICGSDVPRVLHNGAHSYPIVLGHEFAGDVVEVGEGVTELKIGDAVTGVPLLPCMECDDCAKGNYALCRKYSFIGSRVQGSFAEYVVLPEKNAVKFDPIIPYEQAAMFEPSTVALHGVFCNDYRGGGIVAVLGCGTIGIYTLQWARIFGAKSIVAFDVDERRLAMAKRMGADLAINTTQPGFEKIALDFTEGKGFDYTFEVAGNPLTMTAGFALTANRGNMCCIGTPGVQLKFSKAEWEQLNRKEFKLTGSWMSYSSPFPGPEWTLTAHYLATGQLKFDPELIYKKFFLSQVADAFEEFRNPKNVHGKIMLINE